MHLIRMYKEDKLWSITTLFWYLTVFSSFFMEYLFRIALPIGGHFFLYRLVLPVTVLLYGIWCIKHKHNPLKGISLIEKVLLVLLGSMLLYGFASFFWAISKGAWFSQMLSTGMSFCFLYLAVQFYKDPRTRKGTVLLACAIMLFCCLGGLVEMSHGCFFDTPYAGTSFYRFMGEYYQAPIFTFYNQNGLSASAFWVLIIGFLYLFDQWNDLSTKKRSFCFWLITIATCLCFFIFCATGSRLVIWAIPVFLIGVAFWMFLRYKKGQSSIVIFACCLLLCYAGENYENIKSLATYYKEYIVYEITVSKTPSNEQTPPPNEQTPPPNEQTPPPPEKPELSTPNHTTMGNLIPTDGESGKISLSSDQSGSIRVNLLKNSLEMILASKCLGIGVGNCELRMSEYDNTSNLTDVHCFIVEIILEFGIFALVPLIALGLVLCRNWLKRILQSIRQKDKILFSNTLFQIFMVLTYPFLSTINSSSWGLSAMWLFLAYIVQDHIPADRTTFPAQALSTTAD